MSGTFSSIVLTAVWVLGGPAFARPTEGDEAPVTSSQASVPMSSASNVPLSSSASAGGPTTGRMGGTIGLLDVEVKGSALEANVAASSPTCTFEPERRVLDALYADGVLVGTVMLCQTGEGCPAERAYPFFGLWDPASRSVTSLIQVDEGCSSPALDGEGKLTLETRPTPRAHASDAWRKKARAKKLSKSAERSYAAGQQFFIEGQYAPASQEFFRTLSYDPRQWTAYLALGMSQFKLGHVESAVHSYQRSLDLKPDFAETYFNLACAHARLGRRESAIDSLRKALKSAGSLDAELMAQDPDLNALLGNDEEFAALVQEAAMQAKQRPAAPKRSRKGRR